MKTHDNLLYSDCSDIGTSIITESAARIASTQLCGLHIIDATGRNDWRDHAYNIVGG